MRGSNSSPRQALCWGVAIVLFVLLGGCRTTKETLGPEAQSQITRALDQALPTWKWQGAQVQQERVDIKACRAESGRCFQFSLTVPRPWCLRKAGPWCVMWEKETPSSAEAEPLLHALSSVPASIWQSVDIPARPSQVWATAAALVLAPFMLGGLFGVWLRRRRMARLPIRLMLAIAPLAISVSLLFHVSWGFHDLAAIGLLCSIGLIAGTVAELRWKPLLGLTVPLLAMLLGLGEWASRRLPPVGEFALPNTTSLEYRTELRLFCGSLAYDDHWSGLNRWDWPAKDDQRPMVIHLGDSIIFGAGVEPSETAVEELNRRSVGVVQANFGIPGVATDAELSTLRRRFDRIPTARLVLMHFFLGNDLDGIDEHTVCSNDGPIFDYGNGHLIERASREHVKPTPRMLMELTPPPYPIRVLAPYSALARQTVRGFQLITKYQASWYQEQTPGPNDQWEHLALVLKTLRRETEAHGMQLIMSVIPDRPLLEADHPETLPHWELRQRLLKLNQELGIETIDPWNPLRDAVRSGQQLYLPAIWEVHFSPLGHRWYAEWLSQTLGPRLLGPVPK